MLIHLSKLRGLNDLLVKYPINNGQNKTMEWG